MRENPKYNVPTNRFDSQHQITEIVRSVVYEKIKQSKIWSSFIKLERSCPMKSKWDIDRRRSRNSNKIEKTEINPDFNHDLYIFFPFVCN